MPIDLTTIIADPGYAPRDWQTKAPPEAWGGSRGGPVRRSDDLDRVMALPRRAQELDGTERAEAIIDIVTARYTRNSKTCRCAQINPERHAAEGCIERLRTIQAIALREIAIVGGLLGPIGVGHGKTLLDLLAPLAFADHARAIGHPNADNLLCVLLVPVKLVPQLAADYDYIGQHFKMPTMIVQGAPQHDRAQPGMPRLQVMPYSRLSRSDATSWLRVVRPHAIIADECHKLRDSNTATVGRFMSFCDEYRDTRLAAWSGSLTSKSIKDYAHLAAIALKGGTPLPIDPDNVDDWARAIDPSPNMAEPGALLNGLIASGCCAPGEHLRTGFRRRVTETIGVVSTTIPSVSCKLEVNERVPKYPMPEAIRGMISQALAFKRPDGEELVTAMQAFDTAITIACGYHYKWIYPKHVFPRDTQLVEDWLEARKNWHCEVRAVIKARREHMDSPLLARFAAERFHNDRPRNKGLPVWDSKTYIAWRDIKPKVQKQGAVVRLDDFLVRDAVDWMHSHKGVVWYHHNAFADWVAEVSGLPCYGAAAGAKLGLLAERGDRSVLCSIKAHGTGTNGLQFNFADQLFGTVPADPTGWEQTLGRMHRAGQQASIVRADFYMHTRELRKHIATALKRALYIEGTMGSDQKLTGGITDEIATVLDEEFEEE